MAAVAVVVIGVRWTADERVEKPGRVHPLGNEQLVRYVDAGVDHADGHLGPVDGIPIAIDKIHPRIGGAHVVVRGDVVRRDFAVAGDSEQAGRPRQAADLRPRQLRLEAVDDRELARHRKRTRRRPAAADRPRPLEHHDDIEPLTGPGDRDARTEGVFDPVAVKVRARIRGGGARRRRRNVTGGGIQRALDLGRRCRARQQQRQSEGPGSGFQEGADDAAMRDPGDRQAATTSVATV